MKLIYLLKIINETAIENGLSQPYLCGGLPRDKAINKNIHLNDVDITTGDATVHVLSKKVHEKLKNIPAKHIVMDDGHSSIMLPGLKLDFSSNFIVPNIENIVGISLSPLHKEMISRDFTCNSLLMSMDLTTIYDPLKKGLKDIEKQVIDTCLPPNITLYLDPNRIVRAIYLSSKLGFDLSPRVESWIIKNKQILNLVSQEYMVKKLNKALQFNYKNTIELIKKLELENVLPLNYIDFKASL
jgi:tRNA nucleotidyltransferase/poly(A) polymerase